MRVRNLMEPYVRSRVDDMFERLKAENPDFIDCDCEACRLDALCYVLNRVPPKYTISSRGVNHAHREFEHIKQISADVDTIVMNAINIVNKSKRPHHDLDLNGGHNKELPHFFFPVFSGYAYDGTNFESLHNATITLLLNGEVVEMTDASWQNPYSTFKATEGSYNFSPAPMVATEDDVSKDFHFVIRVDSPGYDSIYHTFIFTAISNTKAEDHDHTGVVVKMQDLFLFPIGTENPMERYPCEDEAV